MLSSKPDVIGISQDFPPASVIFCWGSLKKTGMIEMMCACPSNLAVLHTACHCQRLFSVPGEVSRTSELWHFDQSCLFPSWKLWTLYLVWDRAAFWQSSILYASSVSVNLTCGCIFPPAFLTKANITVTIIYLFYTKSKYFSANLLKSIKLEQHNLSQSVCQFPVWIRAL